MALVTGRKGGLSFYPAGRYSGHRNLCGVSQHCRASPALESGLSSPAWGSIGLGWHQSRFSVRLTHTFSRVYRGKFTK